MHNFILLVAAALLITGCANELDGKYVLDADGNLYQLEWRIGGLYAPLDVDTATAKRITELSDKIRGD